MLFVKHIAWIAPLFAFILFEHEFPVQIWREPSEAPTYAFDYFIATQHNILQFLPKEPDFPFTDFPLNVQYL